VAFPPPQKKLSQLCPVFESIQVRITWRYAVPHEGVQLPYGNQADHTQPMKKFYTKVAITLRYRILLRVIPLVVAVLVRALVIVALAELAVDVITVDVAASLVDVCPFILLLAVPPEEIVCVVIGDIPELLELAISVLPVE
jgi:hypothetical protein